MLNAMHACLQCYRGDKSFIGEQSLVPSSDFLCYIITHQISFDFGSSPGQQRIFDDVDSGSEKF